MFGIEGTPISSILSIAGNDPKDKFRHSIFCMDYSEHHKMLAVGTKDGKIVLFEPETGNKIDVVKNQFKQIYCVRFIRITTKLSLFATDSDGTINIVEFSKGFMGHNFTSQLLLGMK